MRRASSDQKIVVNKDGNVFIGISLGYDYCSEHEWGYVGIKTNTEFPNLTKPIRVSSVEQSQREVTKLSIKCRVNMLFLSRKVIE